jgi:hypothetical protein
MPDHMTVKLEVSLPTVRDALLDGCAWVIAFEKKNREESKDRLCSLEMERCERRMVLARELDDQLEAGYAVVDVPLEVADGVAGGVAAAIGEEMSALIWDAYDMQPRGVVLERAADLMQTLVALDAAIERRVMPYDGFALQRTPSTSPLTPDPRGAP